MNDYDKPYFTVNITVENEVGDLFAVWRSNSPFDVLEAAVEQARSVADDAEIDFDRMDE